MLVALFDYYFISNIKVHLDCILCFKSNTNFVYEIFTEKFLSQNIIVLILRYGHDNIQDNYHSHIKIVVNTLYNQGKKFHLS